MVNQINNGKSVWQSKGYFFVGKISDGKKEEYNFLLLVSGPGC
jgi:hypothetical protein